MWNYFTQNIFIVLYQNYSWKSHDITYHSSVEVLYFIEFPEFYCKQFSEIFILS